MCEDLTIIVGSFNVKSTDDMRVQKDSFFWVRVKSNSITECDTIETNTKITEARPNLASFPLHCMYLLTSKHRVGTRRLRFVTTSKKVHI